MLKVGRYQPQKIQSSHLKLPDYQFNYQTGRNTLGHEFLEIMFKALAAKKTSNQSL